ncbi:MAG: hypothetical protein WCG87_00290 [Bacteroidota bacterium]
MSIRTVAIIILFYIYAVNGYAQGTLKNGVVKVDLEKMSSKDSVVLYEVSGEVYSCIKHTGVSSGNVHSRYYYPDKNILILDCVETADKYYKVLVNNRVVLILRNVAGEQVSYMPWQVYLKGMILKLDKNTSLYTDSTSHTLIAENNTNTYTIKRVKGEWCYVECNTACNECPAKGMSGWVRWRKGNKLLIDIRFGC